MKGQGKVTKAAQELKRATGRGSNVSMVEVAEHFFQRVGGAKEFAKLLYDELCATKAGGMIRARILDIIMQAVKFINTTTPPVEDLAMFSDEDLERELEIQTLKVARDRESPTDSTLGPDRHVNPGGAGLAPLPLQGPPDADGVGPTSSTPGERILPDDEESGNADSEAPG